jgi:ubiquinone/menaquinone biosynthesis C-methylase UbiE
MPDTGWWAALWPDPAGVLAQVGVLPGMEVIDLCSGDGWFTLHIAKRASRVVAIDIDPQLIETTRQRLRDSGVSNCDFMTGDAYELAGLTPRPADFVFMANAFHGVPDQPRLALAIRQALKPSGHLAIVNWHQTPREETTILGEPRGPKTELRLSPEQTIEAVKVSGLTFVETVNIPPYHYAQYSRDPHRENRDASFAR